VKRLRYAAGLLGGLGLAMLLPVSAGAATKTVTMGLPTAKDAKTFNEGYLADVNDYFPHATSVRVGDKVKFVPKGFHNVEFPAKGKDPVGLVAPTGNKIAGVLDEAKVPFWFNGQDELNFNPVLFKMLFGKKVNHNGTKGIQSGLPLAPKPKPMTVTFKKAGSFTYYCGVHPGMEGKVKVVPKSKRAASAKAHRKAIRTQVARDLKIAKALPKKQVPAGTVDVGVAGPHGVEYFGMLPAKVTVSAGQALNFRMTKGSVEVHTATFGPGNPESEPNSYLGTLAKSFEGNLDQRAVYPSEAPATTSTLTPALHGNGFWNSGVMDLSPATPSPSQNSVRFGNPAPYALPRTYSYYCLVHPFMKGEVTVQ
jgi:plastocyanin